eukprot:437855-Pelagomonas_calceolata.AAC.2
MQAHIVCVRIQQQVRAGKQGKQAMGLSVTALAARPTGGTATLESTGPCARACVHHLCTCAVTGNGQAFQQPVLGARGAIKAFLSSSGNYLSLQILNLLGPRADILHNSHLRPALLMPSVSSTLRFRGLITHPTASGGCAGVSLGWNADKALGLLRGISIVISLGWRSGSNT